MKRRKNRLPMKLILICLTAILLWLMFFSKYNIIKIIKSNLIINGQTQKIETMEKQKKDLTKERALLKEQNPKIMEQRARELGMAKEGEIIIRIKEEDKSKNSNNE